MQTLSQANKAQFPDLRRKHRGASQCRVKIDDLLEFILTDLSREEIHCGMSALTAAKCEELAVKILPMLARQIAIAANPIETMAGA